MGGGGVKSLTGFSPDDQCYHRIARVVSLVLTGDQTLVCWTDPNDTNAFGGILHPMAHQ
jgi:hypothetical protein